MHNRKWNSSFYFYVKLHNKKKINVAISSTNNRIRTLEHAHTMSVSFRKGEQIIDETAWITYELKADVAADVKTGQRIP